MGSDIPTIQETASIDRRLGTVRQEIQMRNTNLLALAAALILGYVWWTNATPTKVAAPRGVQVDASQAMGVQKFIQLGL